MAGPGGGPPRRSHTKSRKGCETCKRRHIRCDENFPQCRNCTKHKIRCPYNDMPPPDDRSASPEKPDLMWTPEIEAAIDHWRQTGLFPFPALNVYPAPNPQEYSAEELRLIYHIASICNELSTIDANHFTLWTRQIPTILRIAATNRYVMHALLGFAASHIAWLTDCPLVSNMSYEHRGFALSGIQDAIASFSQETSDAVLAASLVLSWQAADWKSWTQLMTGTSSVINAMGDWRSESQFGDFIAETDTFPTAPPSPTPDHRPAQPRDEDYQAFNQTIHQLQKVEGFLKANKADTKPIAQLISFVKVARKVSPAAPVSQRFDRLQQLRSWLFWLPISFLQKNHGTPNALLVIAQYYTVALVMERLFPEIGAAYFGSMCVGPIEEIARRLASFHVSEPNALTPSMLMAFPMETLTQFRGRMGWVQPVRTPSFPQFTTPNFYSTPPAPLQAVPAVTETYLPYGQNPSFSYSTESLSILGTPEPVPNSAVSPYGSHHFLNIPSPVHTIPYSPASSTFEGSYAAYSDTEDFGTFDFSGLAAMGNSDMLGGASTFGGFVAPIQPVWN